MSSAPSAGRTTGVPRAVVWVLIVLLVAAVAAAAATGYLAMQRKKNALGGLTARESSIVDTARQEMVRVQTYRRASFDADVKAAVDGMTEDQGQVILKNKAALLDTLTKNKFDSSAQVRSSGLISYDGKKTATVLLAVDQVQTDDNGTPFVTKPSAYQMTLTLTGSKWLMSDLKAVVYG